MASEYVLVRGTSKFAKLYRPDPQYECWSIILYPNSESLELIKSWGVKNHLKKDEDGYNYTFRRPQQKLIRGILTPFLPPQVFDKEGKPFTDLIGNGSDVTVKLCLYSYKAPNGNPGKAVRLEGVTVNELVPYIPKRDMKAAEIKAAEGLISPEQFF